MTFKYSRRIQFYETDAMGIVHHGIYLNLFEEARVQYLRESGILATTGLDQINYPVLEAEVKYQKPLYFDDLAEITLKALRDGIRLRFEYEIKTKRFSDIVAFGKTVHVAMEMSTRKPIRLPEALVKLISS